MKAAVVLDADSPSFLRDAGDINVLISNDGFLAAHIELWLFSHQEKIHQVPEILSPLSEIRVFQTIPSQVPEYFLNILTDTMKHYPMQLLIFPGSSLGEEMAARLSFRMNGTACLQVETLDVISHQVEIEKPAYGNHLKARFLLENSPYCVAAARTGAPEADLIPCDWDKIHSKRFELAPFPWIIDQKVIPGETDKGLSTADVVLAAGQGAENKSTIEFVQKVADAMDAKLGGSRQAVMNGWLPVEQLLGVSGKTISPKICIVAGVSGSPVFTTGIQNSDCIIAINIDKEAPIFKVAHVGIVGDLKAVLSELLHLIDDHKQLNGNKK